jgi:1,4-alpha-glucan branching enzyme
MYTMSLKKQFSKSKPVCTVTFSLPKEAVKNAKEVRLLGDFNNWSWEQGIPMKADQKTYSAVVDLEKDKEYQFRYAMDNKAWENDWMADAYVPNVYGIENSLVRTYPNGR